MTSVKQLQTPRFKLFSTHVLVLFLIVLPSFVQAQWNYLNSPVDYESFMEVVNPDTVVYSYGNTGKIYRTVNGGETWSDFNTNLEYTWFYDFDFPTNEIGYGCGGTYFGQYRDAIIKTENAGMTWDTLTTNSFNIYVFEHVKFLNVDTGFVSSTFQLYKTVNGGENFTPVDFFNEGVLFIRALAFSPDGALFAATSQLDSQNVYHISIFRSITLGETWEQVYTTVANYSIITAIQFPTPIVGYALGNNGVFLKTTDSGLSWNETIISPLSDLTALYFTSENVGYINNAGGIWKTTDSGNTWEAQNMNTPAIVRDIQFASENVGYALTDEKIYKTINAGEVLGVEDRETINGITVFPNPASNFVSVNNENGDLESVQLIDLTGRILKSVNQNFENIDISKIASGNYFLRIESYEGTITRKLIIE